jgi:hypothetical protein
MVHLLLCLIVSENVALDRKLKYKIIKSNFFTPSPAIFRDLEIFVILMREKIETSITPREMRVKTFPFNHQ